MAGRFLHPLFWGVVLVVAINVVSNMGLSLACDDDDDWGDDDTDDTGAPDDDTGDDDDRDDDVDTSAIEGTWSLIFRCYTYGFGCEEDQGTVTFTFDGDSLEMDFGDLVGPATLSGNEITYTDLESSEERYIESGTFTIDGNNVTWESEYEFEIEGGHSGECRGNGFRNGFGTPTLDSPAICEF
ncbi:MAG: hypothetical protein H6684_14940 [Deltaproteobacteria bacterium]|nr:hypothetical protein [Deltaproteobacteria bacterium]MCB9479235.1 hypothetical protein [Deltaproteobacteria bacterium]MCB9490027.1 hypothetical protein [Deltaproteobacteria bacterium]